MVLVRVAVVVYVVLVKLGEPAVALLGLALDQLVDLVFKVIQAWKEDSSESE